MRRNVQLLQAYRDVNPCFLQDTVDWFTGRRAGHMSPWLYSVPQYDGDRANGSVEWAKVVQEAKNGSDYYVFSEEERIIRESLPDIAALSGRPISLIDLGPGSADAFNNKVAPVIRSLRGSVCKYIPVDVSTLSLDVVESASHAIFPDIAVQQVRKDFLQEKFTYAATASRTVSTFFGLTLFNLQIDPRITGLPESVLASSLTRLKGHHKTRDNYMLLTQDSTQNVDKLVTAYTACQEYFKPLLHRIARDFQVTGNYDPDAFDFGTQFFPETSAFSMYFSPTENMNFTIEGQPVSLKKGQKLFFHNAFKMTPDRFLRTAHDAGYEPVRTITEPNNNHVLHILKF